MCLYGLIHESARIFRIGALSSDSGNGLSGFSTRAAYSLVLLIVIPCQDALHSLFVDPFRSAAVIGFGNGLSGFSMRAAYSLVLLIVIPCQDALHSLFVDSFSILVRIE